MFTYILDLLLVTVAAGMLLRGRYGITRQLAFAPLLTAALDVTFAHQLQLSLTPVLSGLLIALQAVILVGCGFILHHDRVMARNKQARRQRRRAVAQARAAFEAASQRRSAIRPVARVA